MKYKSDLRFIIALIVLMINNQRIIFLPFTLLAASYILIYANNRNDSKLRNMALVTILIKVFRTLYVFGLGYLQTPIILQVIIDILPSLATLFLLIAGIDCLKQSYDIRYPENLLRDVKVNFITHVFNVFIMLSLRLLTMNNPINILATFSWIFQRPIYMLIELSFLAASFALSKGLRDLYTKIELEGEYNE